MQDDQWVSVCSSPTLNPFSVYNLTFLNKFKQRRQWHPTPVFLPGKSHGRRSLVGCSPWGCKKLDMTERLHFHFSLSCIGEGNGNPLQCSCLENPRDRGAWWAAIYGVAQSWTWLKRLSNSSNKFKNYGPSSGVQWLRLGLLLQGARVPSLVGELNSHVDLD